MPSAPDRTTLTSRVLILLVAALVGGCGGRGPKKSDGGVDAAPAGDAGDAAPDDVVADAAPDRTDAAAERADATDAIDTAGPLVPACVSRPGVAPACGEALCGNGKRDTCTVTACTDGTISFPAEACDGADVAGATCVADGWGSGAVTCSAECAVVKTACSVCAPLDATLVACTATPFPSQRSDLLRLAATDTGAALAWVSLPLPKRLTLSVARLSPTLELLGVTTLEDMNYGAEPTGSFTSVSIAPFGTGWIVAAIVDLKTVIFHIVDEAGNDKGRVVLDTIGDEPRSTLFVSVVSRPTGGAMAVWSGTNTIKSATIAADGTVVARPPLSLAVLVNVFPSNAAWFGDAAYLVLTSSDEASATVNRTMLVRFATDGSAPSGVTLFNELSQPHVLAADADELLFLYQGRLPNATPDEPGGPMLRRFDAKGVATASPTLISAARRGEAVLSSGDDALVVMADGGRSLGVERRSRTGTIVTPERFVARFPVATPLVYFTAARRGPEVIVAWSDVRSGANSIGAARLAQ